MHVADRCMDGAARTSFFGCRAVGVEPGTTSCKRTYRHASAPGRTTPTGPAIATGPTPAEPGATTKHVIRWRWWCSHLGRHGTLADRPPGCRSIFARQDALAPLPHTDPTHWCCRSEEGGLRGCPCTSASHWQQMFGHPTSRGGTTRASDIHARRSFQSASTATLGLEAIAVGSGGCQQASGLTFAERCEGCPGLTYRSDQFGDRG